jgi:hypothetical protein
VKLICTWPVEVSAGVAKFWVPLLGHSMAWPPEAAASFTTTKGENRLCPDRLSSSTVSTEPAPEELLDELDVVPLDDELDEELLLEDELDEELLELEEELLLELEELEVLPPPQPMGASDTTISSIHTSALLLLKLCQPNIT